MKGRERREITEEHRAQTRAPAVIGLQDDVTKNGNIHRTDKENLSGSGKRNGKA